jgi:prephenate dehydrogenase
MAVIGTGLIGTSVALAARQEGVTVYLSDRNEHHARTAAALGAGLIARPPEPVDLAVIAVPPSEVGPVLVQQQALGTADCYTDVAAVKHAPEQHFLQHASEPSRYVGGHPMAGSERSGPRAGRADLFRGRAWVLTPSAYSGEAALARGLELLEICGAAPVLMDSRLHDERMALTSHVPHVMASLTAARLVGTPDQVPVLVGRGFLDTTRIARGGSTLWSDILKANAASIAAVLTELQDDLARLVEALMVLAAGDESETALVTVEDLLERGIAGLTGISETGPDTEMLWVTALAEQAALRQRVSEPTVQQ